MTPKRIIRPKEAMSRLSCGRTKFYSDYVRTGRLRLIPLGPRNVGILESELDALIDQLVAERDAAPPRRGRPRNAAETCDHVA
jgi:predicted DNA-binding transcriptional regulator AlpA